MYGVRYSFAEIPRLCDIATYENFLLTDQFSRKVKVLSRKYTIHVRVEVVLFLSTHTILREFFQLEKMSVQI